MAPTGRIPKTKPDDLGCESVQAARVYTHHRHLLLLLSPKADTHFTVPRRAEGWVYPVGWLHTEMVYPSQQVKKFAWCQIRNRQLVAMGWKRLKWSSLNMNKQWLTSLCHLVFSWDQRLMWRIIFGLSPELRLTHFAERKIMLKKQTRKHLLFHLFRGNETVLTLHSET